MFTICVVLLSPTLLFAITRLAGGRQAASKPLAVLEWLFDALLLASLTLLIFMPIGRVTISPWAGHPLSFAYGTMAAAFSVAAGLVLGALTGLRRGRLKARAFKRAPRFVRFLVHLLALILLFFTFAYLWGMRRYPITSIAEIIFHLNMPLEGTSEFFVSDVLLSVALPTAAVFALLECWAFLTPRLCAREVFLPLHGAETTVRLLPLRLPLPLAAILLGGWLALLFPCLNLYLDILPFIYNSSHLSALIEEEYVEPREVAITFPQEKRNLITIYLESAETTFQDTANGGQTRLNYTPELTRIARENVSFSQSELIEGAAVAPACGWTIAGLIAQTSGLPLKLFMYDANWVDNRASSFVSFLPGVTSLDDLLSEQGYRSLFLAGSDFTFGGRRLYFTQHGGVEIWDLLSAYEEGRLPEDYYVGWGFEDRKLYEYAREKLTELAQSDEPFHFSLLTVDTHSPGFSYECCPEDIADPYLRIVACASRQLGEFLAWCQEQPFYENTTIVITGDHSSMAEPEEIPTVTVDAYDKHDGSTSRFVYNAFVNAAVQPAQEKNRLFTTMDFFPSVLASIGVTIEGDRLGLGTNLFGNRQTLSEEYGYDALFTELSRISTFYNEELLYP